MAVAADPRTPWSAPAGRWRDAIGWRRLGGLVALAVLFAVVAVPNDIFVGGDGFAATGADYAGAFGWEFLRTLFGFVLLLVTLTIADNLRVAPGGRVAVLVAALLLGALLASLGKCLLPGIGSMPGYVCAGFPQRMPWAHLLSADSLTTLVVGGLVALAYFQRRHDRRIADALHAAEMARVDVERATLAADLQAMQARIEPTFLFDTLGAIGDAYDRAPAAGEKMLDELITYLRATLPDVRQATSTLGRELEVTRGYVAILALSPGYRLAPAFDLPPALAAATVPPMLILPLLAAALRADAGAGAAPTAIGVHAQADGARIRIDVRGDGPAIRSLAGSAIVRETRERMHALHADRGTLTVDVAADGRFAATIEVPHARA